MSGISNICDLFDVDEISGLLDFPLFFEIETVHKCNAKCRMCTIETWPERNDFMDANLFRKIASELGDHAQIVRACTLCRDGEPLLDRGLEEKISMLKANGIKHVVISTNASILDKKRSLSLLDSGLDEIMFSVDGYTKETFEAIRTGLHYETVLRNILGFLEERALRGSRLKVRVRMILQSSNISEFGIWYRFWKNKVCATDKVYAKPIHSWGNQLDMADNAFTEIRNMMDACSALWTTMIIHSDGAIPACSVDYKNIFLSGNVSDQTIKSVWNSEMLTKLRRIHLAGRRDDIDLCRNCYLWDRSTIVNGTERDV